MRNVHVWNRRVLKRAVATCLILGLAAGAAFVASAKAFPTGKTVAGKVIGGH